MGDILFLIINVSNLLILVIVSVNVILDIIRRVMNVYLLLEAVLSFLKQMILVWNATKGITLELMEQLVFK